MSERLSVAAEWMCSLFQTEMETLETQLEKQNKLQVWMQHGCIQGLG